MSPILTKVFLIIVPGMLYLQVMQPLYKGGGTVFAVDNPVVQLRQLSGEYDKAVLQAKDLSSQAEEFKVQYGSVPQETKDRLAIMVPQASSTQADPVRLLDEVNSIIEQAGFAASAISYRELEGSATNKEKKGYTLAFTVEGTYQKFKELIATFESSMRVYVVQTISFSTSTGSEKEENSGLLSFRIVLETYLIK